MQTMTPKQNINIESEQASSSSISSLLQQIHDGNSDAQEGLFQVIYGQLRQMAQNLMSQESPGHTLQASALVNEAYLKLQQADFLANAQSKRHLFGAAARAMQQVLIDHARSRATGKHGGNMQRHGLDVVLDQFEATHNASFLDLENALNRLQAESERQYEALTLRFFGGLSVAEVATLLGLSQSTAEADWRIARAKLYAWLKES